MSRRRLIAASGAVLLAAACTDGGGDDDGGDGGGSGGESSSPSGGPDTGSAPDGALGVNFNEDPTGTGLTELDSVKASWLRGFVRADKEPGPVEHRALSALLTASEHGYGTVLNLKLPFQDQAFPRPDSAEMDRILGTVDKVLDTAMDKVNILAVGNEPFIESRQRDWSGPLGDFYEKVAHHVLDYRADHFGDRCATRVYMGALNRLEKPEWRGKGPQRWMEFVRATDGIEGVDIHPHVSAVDSAQQYLDFILPRLRDGQKFLVTEFSLVWLWKSHLGDRVPARFAARYGTAPGTKVWQAIKDATEHPWSQDKWDDLLTMSPWYAGHRHYLKNQVQRFRDTGRLAVATYPVVQGAAMVKDFGPGKNPWLLNPVYASRTVRQDDKKALPTRNVGWYEDFRALQRDQDRRPVHTGTVAS
ncbi:hypothetical protein [Streptomyces sp. NPDC050560]|uniref:hypothetical protein n=1 Tax=Streptomyces sp. NPDC050560 TaxID=3365630 RepID=UPI0037B6662A